MPEKGSAEKTGNTVGSYLREVRESKGIELEEAARVTRIGGNYLAAIEEEMFDKLPSPAYVKGFLRVYAVYLGLPGDEVIAMFDNTRNPQQIQLPRDVDGNPAQKRLKGVSLPIRWIVPILLLGAVLVTAYIYSDKEEKTKRESETNPTVSPSQRATQQAAVLPPRSSATSIPATPPFSSEDLKNAPAVVDGGTQGGIILRLKVNQDCWLNITIDNSISQQYDLKSGDLIEWKGEKVFALDIGNAGGIEGEFNGRPLKPFGESGKTAHVILRAQET